MQLVSNMCNQLWQNQSAIRRYNDFVTVFVYMVISFITNVNYNKTVLH